MNIEQKVDKKDWRMSFEVEIPAEEFKSETDEKIAEIMKSVTMPGFRKGKVPAKLINAKYKNEIESETKANIAKNNITKILEEKTKNKEFQVFSYEGVFENHELIIDEKNNSGTLKFSIEVFPFMKLEKSDYTDISVEYEPSKYDDKMLDDQLKKECSNYIEEKVYDEITEIDDETFIIADTEGFLDEDEISYYFNYDYKIKVNSDDVIPDLSKNLIGKKQGDTVSFTAQIKNSDKPNLQKYLNKDLTFKVIIKKIFKNIIPDLDDALAIKAGFDSFDNMKESIKKRIENQIEENNNNVKMNCIAKKIAENKPVEIPDKIIELESENLINYYKTIFKIPEEVKILLKLGFTNREEFNAANKEFIIEKLNQDMVIDAYIANEDIELDKETIDKKLEEEAKRFNFPSKIEVKRQLITENKFEEWKFAIKKEIAKTKLIELNKFIPKVKSKKTETDAKPTKEAKTSSVSKSATDAKPTKETKTSSASKSATDAKPSKEVKTSSASKAETDAKPSKEVTTSSASKSDKK